MGEANAEKAKVIFMAPKDVKVKLELVKEGKVVKSKEGMGTVGVEE
jgi:predicted ABC-class ATPase